MDRRRNPRENVEDVRKDGPRSARIAARFRAWEAELGFLEAYRKKKDWEGAVEALTRFLESPHDPPVRALAYYRRGEIREKNGLGGEDSRWDYEQAAAFLEPSDPAEYHLHGLACLKAKRMDEAVASFTKVIEAVPDEPEAYFNRGVAFCRSSDAPEALRKGVADFSQAIGLDPENARYHSWRAQAYRELGRHEEAMADMARAIALNPAEWVYYRIRAEWHEEDKRYDAAVADWSKTIEIAPEPFLEYLHRGKCRERMGDTAEASKDYTTLIGLIQRKGRRRLCSFTRASLAKAYHRRGDLRLRTGDARGAASDFTKAIRMEPDNMSHYEGRAASCAFLGLYPLALYDMKRCVANVSRAAIVTGEAQRLGDRLRCIQMMAGERPDFFDVVTGYTVWQMTHKRKPRDGHLILLEDETDQAFWGGGRKRRKERASETRGKEES